MRGVFAAFARIAATFLLFAVPYVALGAGSALASALPKAQRFAIGYTVAAAAALGAYLLYVRFIERRHALHELALDHGARDVAIGLIVGGTYMATTIGALALAGSYRVASVGSAAALPAMFVACLGVAIVEELLFRGLVFRRIEARFGSWAAIALSAAFFGGAHLSNPHATVFSTVALALEAGVLLAAAYMRFRTLWVPIGIHTAWNFVQGPVFGVEVSGTDMGGWLTPTISGPAWISGGDFGAEASVFAVALGLVLAAALLARSSFMPWRRSTPSSPVTA